jgi:hypothetical protein
MLLQQGEVTAGAIHDGCKSTTILSKNTVKASETQGMTCLINVGRVYDSVDCIGAMHIIRLRWSACILKDSMQASGKLAPC